MNSNQVEHFKKALLILFEETFDKVQGIYLDKNTSLFETLATINAEEASIPVGGKCATLAAQVKHVAFYLDVIENVYRDPDYPPVDWGEIWQTINQVTPDEWQTIQEELRANYTSFRELVETTPDWKDEKKITLMIAAITHTAYHLGEIRQALCIIHS